MGHCDDFLKNAAVKEQGCNDRCGQCISTKENLNFPDLNNPCIYLWVFISWFTKST